MNTKLTVAVALVAGLLGGLLTRYVAPPIAFAQDQASVTNEIRARSFTLTDSSDNTIGAFTAKPIPGTGRMVLPNPLNRPNGQVAPPQIVNQQMRIVLRDSNGREIWSAGGGTRMLPAVTAR